MSITVNVHQAKTHLSRLLERVRQGEDVVIAKAGRPIARLIPVREEVARRVPGSARGLIRVSADFDAPLPDGVQRGFEQ
ncbi:MAG: type II toxin-antitoxin system Phd/YefM family antitoxin [Bacillota bacterium]